MEDVRLEIPDKINLDNRNDVDKDVWDSWNEESKILFNYLMELSERNEKYIFATDLFKIEGTENKINLHKIMHAAMWNIAYEAARFLTRPEME